MNGEVCGNTGCTINHHPNTLPQRMRCNASSREKRIKKAAKRSQVPALCCVCGTQRLTTDHGGYGERTDVSQWAYYRAQNLPITPTRCTVRRKCQTCGKPTRHAYLRDDEERNEAEVADHLEALPTQLEVWELLTELRLKGNVRIREVNVDPDDEDDREMGVAVHWYLYENSWTVTIYGPLPADELASRLRRVQQRMANKGEKWWLYPEDGRQKPGAGVFFPYIDNARI